MAYEFKKLSDVAAVETLADTANVLIEENGVIKKVAKGEIGGGVKVASTAEVGQAIVVKAIDENGNPTEWECADLATQPDMVITVNGMPRYNSKPSLTDVSITSGSFEALENLIRSGTVPNVVVRFCYNMNHVGEIPPCLVEASEHKAAITWYGSAVHIKIIVSSLDGHFISYRFLYDEGELSIIDMFYFKGTLVS